MWTDSRTGCHCYNNIIRNVEGSLKITYFLATLIGAQLRSSDKQEGIMYDKNPAIGLTPSPRDWQTPYDNCTTRTNAQTCRSVPQPGVVLHWCATLTYHYQRLTGFTALQSCLVVRFRVLTLNLHGSQHLNFFLMFANGNLGTSSSSVPLMEWRPRARWWCWWWWWWRWNKWLHLKSSASKYIIHTHIYIYVYVYHLYTNQ